MCLICIKLLRQEITLEEAQKAAREINYTRHGSDHAAELEESIRKMDLKMLAKVLKDGINES